LGGNGDAPLARPETRKAIWREENGIIIEDWNHAYYIDGYGGPGREEGCR